jgi:hypothetical protein
MAKQATPGPWIVRQFPVSRAVYVMDSIPDTDGRVVANLIAAPNTNPAWEANAYLIAAAPELLEACRELIAWDDANRSLDFPQKIIDLARAAIDKAEGR